MRGIGQSPEPPPRPGRIPPGYWDTPAGQSGLAAALGAVEGEGCSCAVLGHLAPCAWCTSHEPGCEWPDDDCDCYGETVAAIVRLLPYWQRQELRDLDAHLQRIAALYEEPT